MHRKTRQKEKVDKEYKRPALVDWVSENERKDQSTGDGMKEGSVRLGDFIFCVRLRTILE